MDSSYASPGPGVAQLVWIFPDVRRAIQHLASFHVGALHRNPSSNCERRRPDVFKIRAPANGSERISLRFSRHQYAAASRRIDRLYRHLRPLLYGYTSN